MVSVNDEFVFVYSVWNSANALCIRHMYTYTVYNIHLFYALTCCTYFVKSTENLEDYHKFVQPLLGLEGVHISYCKRKYRITEQYAKENSAFFFHTNFFILFRSFIVYLMFIYQTIGAAMWKQ